MSKIERVGYDKIVVVTETQIFGLEISIENACDTIENQILNSKITDRQVLVFQANLNRY